MARCNLRITVSAAMLLIAAQPAIAGTSEGYGLGGPFARYDPVIAAHNASGEQLRIVGTCQSSCTLFLGVRNVCVKRNATLRFHSGHDRQRRPVQAYTDRMLSAYNGKLRGYLSAGGYMKTTAFHDISGGSMIDRFGYAECRN